MYRTMLFAILANCFAQSLAMPPGGIKSEASQPESKWVVNFDENRCVAIRQYRTIYGETIFNFIPDLLSNSATIKITFPKNRKADSDWGDISINWTGNEIKNYKNFGYLLFAADEKRLLTLRVTDFPESDAFDFILNFKKNERLAFHLTDWTKLRNVLNRCVVDLRKSKGFPEEEYQKIAIHAKAELTELFRSTDYPPDAIRNRQQGSVQVFFWVETNGLVTDCRIDESSGSSSLDNRTCEVIKRAKFTPAFDRENKPIREPQIARLLWVLPG